jgi:hypothetical protein
MNQVIAWAGFLGAWLLVAGPLYQGAIELHEEDIGREAIEASAARVPRPDPPSPWWWLLPPVIYLIRRQRSNAYRRAALAQLTQAQREQFTSFVNKATGWPSALPSWPPTRPGRSSSAIAGRPGCSGS